MADKNIINTSNLNAGVTDNIDSVPIPNGESWTIYQFGAADINLGDNRSTTYLLRFGTVGNFKDLGLISVTGNTFAQKLRETITGNGTKFVRVVRINNSVSNKACPFWIKAQSR